MKRSSLFVRPVSSDSFGLSILESLEVGVPTVASDVCDRPAGCKVFRSRDQSEFNTLCLSELRNEKTNITVDYIYDGFNAIVNCYQSLFRKR